MCVRAFNGGNNTMNKKLVALLAVATMGISVVAATPQTQFTKGETKADVYSKADYYVQSIYFDSDQDVPRVDVFIHR